MAASSKKKKQESKKGRTAQKLTVTQTKLIESQFDTWSKKGADLGTKLIEIESRFDNKESFVPQQAELARLKLVAALELVSEAKEEFAKIGEQYRAFFG